MGKNKNIKNELFFMTLKLIDNLKNLLISCNESLQLELEEKNNSNRHKRKIDLVKKEIDLTELQIVVSNDEIDEILEEINMSELDELIEECKNLYPEFINKLLDIRNKKNTIFHFINEK